jgi:3-hydroxyisobutyrate dehydrogenase-like beta-hydroxyacid dehydrogenase
MKPTLGFVGLGNMGLPMCRQLIDHGYTVFLYDVNPETFIPFEGTGAQPSPSLLHLARHVEVILLSLPNSSVVEQVILGEQSLSAGLTARQAIIDLSSSKPSSTRHLATVLARQDVHLLDAPVSGGVLRAREGTLAILVGGEHEVFEQQMQLLQVLGTRIFYMGGHGAGHLTKARNNLLSATSLASAIEAVLVGRRYGLDASMFIAAMNASTGRSYSTEVKFPQFVLPETFDDGFALALMNKGVHIALEAAAEMAIPLLLGSCVEQIWQAAEEQGFGRAGHTALYTFLKDHLDQHEREK